MDSIHEPIALDHTILVDLTNNYKSEDHCVDSKMVSTYIKSSTPAEGNNISNFNSNHEDFPNQLGQSDLIYNLSDVEKFLPKIQENDLFDETCGETFTRKRKERQDSGSFSLHECKVIRSNSEERTVEDKVSYDDNIRRVSSHEDFEKCKKIINRTKGVPLHEQNHENSFPLKAQNRLKSSSDNIFIKDVNKSSIIGEKYSKIFGSEMDNENSLEHYNMRQKYSKNDSSPLRSSIHEYILFPKRISPNRDPNAIGRECRSTTCEVWEMERDAEKARSSERRSRARRAPQRRQLKTYIPNDRHHTGNSKFHSFTVDQNRQITNIIHDKPDTEKRTFEKKKLNISIKGSDANENSPISKNFDKDNLSESSLMKISMEDSISPNGMVKKIRDRSQSPVVHSISPLRKTPIIDLKTLREQVVQTEPVPSIPLMFTNNSNDGRIFDKLYEFNYDSEPLLDDNIAGYSKEISEIQNQKRILPNKCDYGDGEGLCGNSVMEPDERLGKITKKIQTLKKKIAKSEIDFEISHGYRASHADKMNDSMLRKLYAEVRKLKNERKSIRKGPCELLIRQAPILSNEEQTSLKNKSIAEIMAEIEKRLDAKRWAHGRPSELEKCSKAQLMDEKAAVQRALLWLEGARGRPTSRPDRDSARPLYDRYRTVKRLVAGFDAMKLNAGIAGDLPTIMENEALPTLDSPVDSTESGDKSSLSERETKNCLSENKELDTGASSSTKSTISDRTILQDDDKKDTNENLHYLSVDELNKLLSEAKALKITLRTKIKTMEEQYEEQNLKTVKDDRNPILPTYAKYKETKARIRLLSALVNKQKKSCR